MLTFHTLYLNGDDNVKDCVLQPFRGLHTFLTVSLSVRPPAVHFTVTTDVTSLKSRLRFHDNGQSVYSGYLSMPKKHCETLRVGLLVRHTYNSLMPCYRHLQAAVFITARFVLRGALQERA